MFLSGSSSHYLKSFLQIIFYAHVKDLFIICPKPITNLAKNVSIWNSNTHFDFVNKKQSKLKEHMSISRYNLINLEQISQSAYSNENGSCRFLVPPLRLSASHERRQQSIGNGLSWQGSSGRLAKPSIECTNTDCKLLPELCPALQTARQTEGLLCRERPIIS